MAELVPLLNKQAGGRERLAAHEHSSRGKNMTLVERITEESRHLPVQAQTEALDFIVFLRERYPKPTVPSGEDEISRLLNHPLQIADAKPLSRDEVNER